MKILREFLDAYRARTGAVLDVAEQLGKVADAHRDGMMILSDAVQGPEPEEPPEASKPQSPSEHLRDWMSENGADLTVRDVNEIRWARERLIGKGAKQGSEDDAKRLLTQHLVPKHCWPTPDMAS